MHLATMFGLDPKTAIRYAENARQLLITAAEEQDPASSGELLRVILHVTLGELRLLACPANERLRHAHPGAGMLTVTAPSGTGGTPAAVTDGGGGAGMRRASNRPAGAFLQARSERGPLR